MEEQLSIFSDRSLVAVETKKSLRRGEDPAASPAVTDARRRLAAAKLEQYIQAVVASAPPLDENTKARLALLLSGA